MWEDVALMNVLRVSDEKKRSIYRGPGRQPRDPEAWLDAGPCPTGLRNTPQQYSNL